MPLSSKWWYQPLYGFFRTRMVSHWGLKSMLWVEDLFVVVLHDRIIPQKRIRSKYFIMVYFRFSLTRVKYTIINLFENRIENKRLVPARAIQRRLAGNSRSCMDWLRTMIASGFTNLLAILDYAIQVTSLSGRFLYLNFCSFGE